MITCTLGEKKYSVDFVSGRALRELNPAWEALGWIIGAGSKKVSTEDYQQAMDAMVKWFCILFGGQFAPDEVYDGYPADSLISDIAVALRAVQAQTTEVLKDFPLTPAATQSR